MSRLSTTADKLDKWPVTESPVIAAQIEALTNRYTEYEEDLNSIYSSLASGKYMINHIASKLGITIELDETEKLQLAVECLREGMNDDRLMRCVEVSGKVVCAGSPVHIDSSFDADSVSYFLVPDYFKNRLVGIRSKLPVPKQIPSLYDDYPNPAKHFISTAASLTCSVPVVGTSIDFKFVDALAPPYTRIIYHVRGV